MMVYFVDTDANGDIVGLYTDEPGYAAPPAGAVQVSDADGELLRKGFSGYRMEAGAVVPNAAVQLARAIEAAVAQTYADVDAVYALAIGNREPEYRDAEAAARAFAAAGYTGAVSPFISGWAAAQSPAITDQQAADAIIAKADALAAAKIALRNTRFTAQAAMRAAATQADLDLAVADWQAFVATVKASL